MKRSTLAALLNFAVPGAGLWYLGARLYGVINLAVATAVILLLSRPEATEERMHYVILAVAAGSAGLAHAMATRGEQAT